MKEKTKEKLLNNLALFILFLSNYSTLVFDFIIDFNQSFE